MAEDIALKIPPQNLEAEQSLLGALLIDKDAFFKVADIIEPDDFYKDAHRIIFETMQDLFSKHEPIDLLTLTNLLEEKKLLEKINGRSYLAKLAGSVATSSHIVNYAQIIQKKSTLRRLLKAANEISALGYDEKEELSKTLDIAEQKLFNVSQKHLKESFVPVKNVLSNTFDRIDDLHKNSGTMRGIPTGFKDLDKLTAGLQRSDLIVLAARPAVGKTSLALDLARQIVVNSKTPIGYFSLEMSKEQLVDRMLCAQSGIDLFKIRTGKLSDREGSDDFARLGHAMGILSESPLFIDDSAGLNIMDVRTKCRRLKVEHNLGLIIIDYLQLMEARAGAESRVQAVAEITRALKQIARELNIPIIALSQLSRAVELNKPAIPKLSHLRESGSIEQDADIVMFLYRKAADRNYSIEDLTPEEKNTAELHIAKHRNGPTGLVKFIFKASQASFKPLEKNYNENMAPPM